MTLNIEIIGLNHKEKKLQTLSLKRGEGLPSLDQLELSMVADGGTNLNFITENMKIKAPNSACCIAFTDGGHGGYRSCEVDPLDYDGLTQLGESGGYAKPFVCSVGSAADRTYFDRVACLFGGDSCSQRSVKDFCEYVAAQANELLTPQVAYSLMTQLAQAFWVPRGNGLYDTQVKIKSGQIVKAASGHQTVVTPTVVPKPKAAAAAARPVKHADPVANKPFVHKEGMTKRQKTAAAIKKAVAGQKAGLGKPRKKAGQRPA